MRFEPNINMRLTLSDGRTVRTPIVEIKNLNSFRALRGAIEHEAGEQPARWRETGREMGAGAKTTRGWDDVRQVTVEQRQKEDAHEYRYFPDPDLVPVTVAEEWKERVRASLPELPHQRVRRHRDAYGLGAKEAAAINGERAVSEYFEACVARAGERGIVGESAGRKAANLLLQSGAKRANERGCLISDLGATPEQVAGILALREEDRVSSSAADELFGIVCDADPGDDPETLAERHGLLQVRDEGALATWVEQAMEQNAPSVEAYRGGKQSAIGSLIGAVMRASGGQADPKAARAMLEERLKG